MSDLNVLFRNRIGFSTNEPLTFHQLDTVLELTAKSIPFENLCIMAKQTRELSKENLIDRIIIHNEGGLCYDLNPLLYFFLKENGFDAALVRAVLYDHHGQRWNPLGKTHVAIVITHQGQPYLVDTGFGGNLPLKPVPLSGEVVASTNGEFRVEKIDHEQGEYFFYLKLKHKDKEWKVGYAFDATNVIKDVSELHEVQEMILEHADSPFNKKPLLTRLTDRGNMTLTEGSFVEWLDGRVDKQEVDEKQFKEMAAERFGVRVFEGEPGEGSSSPKC
ncbi:arylamine N-acetyltransferase family protein [Neobacillus jeddahensis]|uniref:arylamine N-acetyltransferase family protein n=1 Tax=Neobacillus jeddahensis TaxID=1461580 RepID=UPI0005A63571|nr:arylamine N-acetyltransferase [Neobacillus jeddahensis]